MYINGNLPVATYVRAFRRSVVSVGSSHWEDQQERGNATDAYAVSVIKEGTIVGHLPRRILSACTLLLRRGVIHCQVAGRRKNSSDLPQGQLEIPCLLTFEGKAKEIKKLVSNNRYNLYKPVWSWIWGTLCSERTLHAWSILMAYYRAIATGPVSPVSTGPLFPSPMACLASPNRVNARQTPMARTQRGDMLQHNTRWLRTVRKTESSNNFPFFQPNDLRRVWLVRLANDRKAETMQCYMAQRAERVDVHACKSLSSGLQEASFCPKNGLRSNLTASKIQKFIRGVAVRHVTEAFITHCLSCLARRQIASRHLHRKHLWCLNAGSRSLWTEGCH